MLIYWISLELEFIRVGNADWLIEVFLCPHGHFWLTQDCFAVFIGLSPCLYCLYYVFMVVCITSLWSVQTLVWMTFTCLYNRWREQNTRDQDLAQLWTLIYIDSCARLFYYLHWPVLVFILFQRPRPCSTMNPNLLWFLCKIVLLFALTCLSVYIVSKTKTLLNYEP